MDLTVSIAGIISIVITIYYYRKSEKLFTENQALIKRLIKEENNKKV